MGQVSWHGVTLERLVAMSEVVVVARRADPPFEQVSVPIDELGTDGTPCRPFTYQRARFGVEQGLQGDAQEEILEVDPADCAWRQQMHRDYYVIGLSTSPVHTRFEGPPVEGDGPRVVFAHREEGRLAFPVSGAEVAIDQVDAVLALMPGAQAARVATGVGLVMALGALGVIGLTTLCLVGLWALS